MANNIINSLKFGSDTNIFSLPYGECSTAAETAAKTVSVANGNFSLETGAIVLVKFTVTNTANSATLNVCGTGAKSIYYRNAAITKGYLAANRIYAFVYDGAQWEVISDIDTNSTYSNASLGQGYGTCSTAEATTAKTVALSSYSLTKGGVVVVKFTYAVPANATLNVNSKGAKNIFWKGAKIVAGVIKAGDTASFIYDGTQYQCFAIDTGRYLNLENGEGTDSIVQKYSGEVDDTHFGNTSTGESAAIFGEANKNTANRALMAGKLNKNNGANHIVGGVYNETTEMAKSGVTTGYQNINNHENAILGGLANKNNAPHTGLVGAYNEITERGTASAGGGQNNKINAENAAWNGENNVINVKNGAAYGYGLKVEGLDGKVVIGRYNAPKSNTIFEVGNGTSDKPSNAFEVYEDGSTNLSGGGGKVYKHYIQLVNISVPVAVVFTVYTSTAEQMTAEKLYEMFPTSQSYAVFCWSATEGKFNYINFSDIGFYLSGRSYVYGRDQIPINDTVTEV